MVVFHIKNLWWSIDPEKLNYVVINKNSKEEIYSEVLVKALNDCLKEIDEDDITPYKPLEVKLNKNKYLPEKIIGIQLNKKIFYLYQVLVIIFNKRIDKSLINDYEKYLKIKRVIEDVCDDPFTNLKYPKYEDLINLKFQEQP